MRKLALLLLLLMLAAITVGAQDAPAEPSPFMRAMAAVPDTTALREAVPMIDYADYHAGITAYGYDVPESWTAFAAAGDVPLTVLSPGGPSGIYQYLMSGGPKYSTLLGFDFFDLTQGVEVGTPPSAGQILFGDFSAVRVEAAFRLRGYSAEPDAVGTLLCPEAGCDTGTQISLANRDPANPFGGALGRSEPAFVTDGVLLNSPDEALLRGMIAAYEGQTGAPSLADSPDVQAVDSVLAAYPRLHTAMLMSPAAFGVLDFGPDLSPEMIEALKSGFDAEPLPIFTLAALAATTDETSEYGLALLVYPDAETAAAAARIVDERMALKSLRTATPYSEVYGEVGTLDAAQVIEDAASGRFVVVLRIAAALRTDEQSDDARVWPYLPYNRFRNSLLMRDTLWMTWGVVGGE